jgi:hypothetical protein
VLRLPVYKAMSSMGKILAAVQRSTDQLGMMIRAKYMMPDKINNGDLVARQQAGVSKQLKQIGASPKAVAQLFNAIEDHAKEESGLFQHLTKHGLVPSEDAMQTVNSLTTDYPNSRETLVDSLHNAGCRGLEESVAAFFDSLARAEKEYQVANYRVVEDILGFLAKPPEQSLQDIVRGVFDSYQNAFSDFINDLDEKKLSTAKDSARQSLIKMEVSPEAAENILKLLKTSLAKELFYVNHLERSGIDFDESVAPDISIALQSYKETGSIEASLVILEKHGYDSSADEKDLEDVIRELIEAQEAFNEEYQTLIMGIATKIAKRN